MNKKRHLIGRSLVYIVTKLYLWLKKVTESLVRRIRFSIGFKIAISYVRWLVFSLFLSMLLINGALWFVTLNHEWNTLNHIGNEFVEYFQETGDPAAGEIKYVPSDNQMAAFILDEKYDEVYVSQNSQMESFEHRNQLFLPFGINRINQSFYFIYVKNMVRNEKTYWILIYKCIDGQFGFLIKFLMFTVAAHVLVIFITVMSGIRSNSKVLKPIKDMTETVKRISGKELSLRINVSGIQDELKELAITINEMMDRIENSYNQQQQFVSDASHELRTPIAVLQGYASLLERWGKNDPKVLEESISAIKNEAESMNELVEKLLFLARSDRNRLMLQKERFNLSELMEELVKETELIDKEHKISYKIADHLLITADRGRLKQALRIFMDNAVKYTPKNGEIFVGAQAYKSKNMIVFKDTGIGISGEDIKHIFDRFYRSDKSRTKEKGGHGLGLAIAKIIILGHGGKIKVKSKLGEGTEFRIII